MKKQVKLNDKKFYSKPKLIKVGAIADNTLGAYGKNDSGGSSGGKDLTP